MQPKGNPEIQRMSFDWDYVHGGANLFIIGRNFDRNLTVNFREMDPGKQINQQIINEALISNSYSN